MVGIIKRVPRELVEELERIKSERNMLRDVDAFKEIAKNNRLVNDIKKFDFFYPMKRRRK